MSQSLLHQVFVKPIQIKAVLEAAIRLNPFFIRSSLSLFYTRDTAREEVSQSLLHQVFVKPDQLL